MGAALRSSRHNLFSHPKVKERGRRGGGRGMCFVFYLFLHPLIILPYHDTLRYLMFFEVLCISQIRFSSQRTNIQYLIFLNNEWESRVFIPEQIVCNLQFIFTYPNITYVYPSSLLSVLLHHSFHTFLFSITTTLISRKRRCRHQCIVYC